MGSPDDVEEQRRATAHIEEMKPALRERALEILAIDPSRRLAAVIIEDGAMGLPPGLSRRRQPIGSSGLVGTIEIVTRESAREVVRASAGAEGVAWFDSSQQDLPIVSVTRQGLRIGWVQLGA